MVQVRGHSGRAHPRTAAALPVLLLASLTAACGGLTPPTRSAAIATSSAAPAQTVSPVQASATPKPTAASTAPVARTIAQPPVPGHVHVAPDSARVDLTVPTFSNPTRVTNPLFPVSRQESVLMLGRVDGKPFRTEVTLLPFTRLVDWEGQRIETLVSQYHAYLDGRIQEVAYDLYAQADDGSVWYFGEDVGDFEDGLMVTKEGTWLAGKDAPAAMIMPGDPQIGAVFRTENSPGFAFEEVTVKSTDQTLPGPLGPIQGGLIVKELHDDGTTEDKSFAPGYGEFLTTAGGDVEALALAVPTNVATGPLPATLAELRTGALHAFEATRTKRWGSVSSALGAIKAAWNSYRATGVPRLIAPRMAAGVSALSGAVRSRNAAQATRAAFDVAQLSLDLQLRYRPAAQVNLARLDLWTAQAVADSAARDALALRGDAFTVMYIRDRLLGSIPPGDLTRVNEQILALQLAAVDRDFAASALGANQLRRVLAPLLAGA